MSTFIQTTQNQRQYKARPQVEIAYESAKAELARNKRSLLARANYTKAVIAYQRFLAGTRA